LTENLKHPKLVARKAYSTIGFLSWLKKKDMRGEIRGVGFLYDLDLGRKVLNALISVI
jgi:hypothetical protein